MLELQREGYALQQVLFIHSGGKEITNTPGALIINRSTKPDYFNEVGDGIWDFLDSVRAEFHKFDTGFGNGNGIGGETT